MPLSLAVVVPFARRHPRVVQPDGAVGVRGQRYTHQDLQIGQTVTLLLEPDVSGVWWLVSEEPLRVLPLHPVPAAGRQGHPQPQPPHQGLLAKPQGISDTHQVAPSVGFSALFVDTPDGLDAFYAELRGQGTVHAPDAAPLQDRQSEAGVAETQEKKRAAPEGSTP